LPQATWPPRNFSEALTERLASRTADGSR